MTSMTLPADGDVPLEFEKWTRSMSDLGPDLTDEICTLWKDTKTKTT